MSVQNTSRNTPAEFQSLTFSYQPHITTYQTSASNPAPSSAFAQPASAQPASHTNPAAAPASISAQTPATISPPSASPQPHHHRPHPTQRLSRQTDPGSSPAPA